MTIQVAIGKILIGGGAPVAIQSMTNTDTSAVAKTVEQILRLERAGCDIVRLAVKSESDARAIKEIKKAVNVPLVADIHFDYRLAILSTTSGVDKIRINPGNLGGQDKQRLVADAVREAKIPLRIGVNGGSLEKEILAEFGHSATALARSAEKNIKIFEDFGVKDIVVSVKSSSVVETIEAYRLLSRLTSYPLHLGVTEAGVGTSGIIKSSIGIGSLLADGIGDTIRVSLSGDPVQEIAVAQKIVEAAGRKKEFFEVISCPTCGRTGIDVEGLAREIEERVKSLRANRHIKIAVMGCVVNGVGEGASADLGVAGGEHRSIIFKGGKTLKTVDNADVFKELLTQIEDINK